MSLFRNVETHYKMTHVKQYLPTLSSPPPFVFFILGANIGKCRYKDIPEMSNYIAKAEDGYVIAEMIILITIM